MENKQTNKQQQNKVNMYSFDQCHVFFSSGAPYNYGVLKNTVRILGGKGAFPLKFDGWLDCGPRRSERVDEIVAFCKSVEEKLFLQTLKCTVFYQKEKNFCIY